MTSLLSSLSGQFTRNLILGSFLPVVVFVTLSMIFVVPIFPADWPLLKPFLGFGIESKLIGLSFIAIVTTGLLFTLNTPLLRLYEGYPWRDSWIGKVMTKRKRKQFAMARARRLGIRALIEEMDRNDERIATLIMRLTGNAGRVLYEFPSSPILILPTSFGNVLRSFEEYSTRQYKMEAITLWPRLVAMINKDYAAGIDDAKTSVDFMINVSVLSFLSATVITTAGWYYFPPVSIFRGANSAMSSLVLIWVSTVVAFLILGYLAYLGAIERAVNWGAFVRGAFDLYRSELLKQLGYERTGLTLKDERYLWDSISGQLLYGDSPWGRDALVEYHINKTVVYSDAPFVDLTIARGVERQADGAQTITIRIKNIDWQRRTARRVRLIDTLPANFDYVWGSASNGDGKPKVVGTNPYRFEIGDMKSLEEATLTYSAVPQVKKE
ncbi:MAG TPA: hypothetical protein VGQ41_22750 [Pyrinomonadaceae bacterium]|nr:hypothetical protein [Pyrinomonadaceae bacterium]